MSPGKGLPWPLSVQKLIASYPSHIAAARALGIHEGTLRGYAKKGVRIHPKLRCAFPADWGPRELGNIDVDAPKEIEHHILRLKVCQVRKKAWLDRGLDEDDAEFKALQDAQAISETKTFYEAQQNPREWLKGRVA